MPVLHFQILEHDHNAKKKRDPKIPLIFIFNVVIKPRRQPAKNTLLLH